MRYLLVLIPIVFISCSPFGFNPMGYEVKHEDLNTAWKKVSAMKYIKEEVNYWKSPIEFYADGGGDCEDFSAALIYELGPDASAVCYRREDGVHCIVLYNGEYIEPIRYGMRQYPPNILYTLTYYEIMELCTDKGRKRL